LIFKQETSEFKLETDRILFFFPGGAGKGIIQEMRHFSAHPVKLSSKKILTGQKVL
jgi:hypothetical protein